MIQFIRLLLFILLVDLGIGFYLLSQDYSKGNLVVGIGVLVFAFVLLPLFLYHRYKNKKWEDYTLDKEKMDKIIDNLKL